MAEDASKAAPPPGGDAAQQPGQPNLADVIAVVKSIGDRVSKLEQSLAGSNPAAKSAEDMAKEKAEVEKKAVEDAAKAAEAAKPKENAAVELVDLKKDLKTAKDRIAELETKLASVVGVAKGVHRTPTQGEPMTGPVEDFSKAQTANEVLAIYRKRVK